MTSRSRIGEVVRKAILPDNTQTTKATGYTIKMATAKAYVEIDGELWDEDDLETVKQMLSIAQKLTTLARYV